jgi:hypothetical protein
MHLKKASVTVAASSLAATSGYTTDVSGLLYRVQYSSTAGTPSSGVVCVVGIDGSSGNQILKFGPLAAGTTAFYPRCNVNAAGSTVLTSSGLDGLIPIGSEGSSDSRCKVNLSAASSANVDDGITFTFWYS